MRSMKSLLLAAVLCAGLWGVERWNRASPVTSSPARVDSTRARQASRSGDGSLPEPRAGSRIESEGVVVRVLPDDNEGSRHQRFIVRLASGQTVMIAHNIDVAPRVEGLERGDTVSFSGEFEDNRKGGVVHWTHRDPADRHVSGWIRWRGRTYQ